MGKEALIVDRDTLFNGKEFQGFKHVGELDYLSVILGNHRYHDRGEGLESNSSLQQIIPYIWIVNKLEKRVFLYKRKANEKPEGEFQETRYLNKYSGGVGGHIDKDTEEESENPIAQGMLRELNEEVEFVGQEYPIPKIVGYVNDDSDEIGKVHFGVVAIAHAEGDVRAKEELGESRFYSVEEVDKLFGDENNEVEGWTKISWPFVKRYLENGK